MRRKRSARNHRALGQVLGQVPQKQRFTSNTRNALMQILACDTGLVLADSMYEDGLALERILTEIGGKRSDAIEIVQGLVRKATADGAEASSIHSWNYFVRRAKAEMQAA